MCMRTAAAQMATIFPLYYAICVFYIIHNEVCCIENMM